ncbi:MAG: phosphate acyltransferase PlsX [Thermodesulfobacteriota bacterium]
MPRIALDAMGGDRGPVELVAGAVQAAQLFHLDVVLVGDEPVLRAALEAMSGEGPGLSIVHASQVVAMDEAPIEAVKRKKDSSIVRACELVRRGEADAVVSAGNSGATMAAAVTTFGRLKGVARPGIASIFPTLKDPLVMMDVGANVDCRPQHLFQFGLMAAAFSACALGRERPRVGLLSIGEEGGKGNALVKKAHDLFQKSSLNYVGNVEGRDTFLGDVDVIVCDGFVGNVCLKLSEGLAEALVAMLRLELERTFLAKVGYLLAKRAFKAFRRRVDYAEYGGAPLLGLKGTGIVCHGRSNAKAIMNAIRMAGEGVERHVNEHLLELLAAAAHLTAAEGAAMPPGGDGR